MQQPAPSVWTLTDGHAGNVRQARALAAAMGLDATDVTLQPRSPWSLLAPRRLPFDSGAFGMRFAARLHAPPSLAIGCGRQGALATRLVRGRRLPDGTHARTVQILDPRIGPSHWDLVIAPRHDGLSGPNVIDMLGSLHPVDDAWLAQGRRAFASLASLPGPRTALLIGGTSAHWNASSADLLGWIDTVVDDVRAQGGSVLATTSRRTPADVVQGLRARLQGVAHIAWTGDADGENPYAGVLAHGQRIVCTADSVNMLSEACATDVPVVVLGADVLQGRPERFVEALRARDRISYFGDALAEGVDRVTPLRETARVAALVRERLGLE